MNKHLSRYLAGLIFLISFLLYLNTMAPTVSFWDCGEFIATSYIMGVPHPPGSPLYLLLGRIFSLIPSYTDIGARVNLISPIVSALAVMFLYLVIVQLIEKWRGAIESNVDRYIAYGSGVIGALTFMVSDSHWFNAVEAEVYAMSTFLTAFVVWLVLRWSQKDKRESHLHYILLITYVLGLATGVHLLNLLALPFITLIIYFRHWEFRWTSFLIAIAITGIAFLVIYQGIIKGLPTLAEWSSEKNIPILEGWGGIAAIILVVISFLAVTFWSVARGNYTSRLILTSLLLIVIGYSSYITIFIRSSQNPAIDENDPETTRQAVAYMQREQYGDFPILNRERWTPETRGNYSGVGDFFWNYQVKKMYLRYFLWQFAGRGPSPRPGVSSFGAHQNEDGVYWWQFGVPLALLIGLFGMGYHFIKDWKHGLSVLALFAATGILIILYLNQPDPQPRERDYSYAGSFFAFSIWIGVGIAGLLELLTERVKQIRKQPALLAAPLVLLLLAMPAVMLNASYHEHNRTGNFVAWDYSYNMLQSCQEGGIVFTNGDNDTFPLWYLQEVEGIRKDVRVINLSLLNTEWYIRQLRDTEPKIPISLTDAGIAQMRPMAWQSQKVTIPVDDPKNKTGKLEWTLNPTYGQRFVRTQDRMIVQIIKDTAWERPIYFAVTVAPENKIGLDRYLEMEGLVFRLRPYRTRGVNYELLRTNMLEVYRYRNLDNPTVHFNENIKRLLQNYRTGFLQLAVNQLMQNNQEEALLILQDMEKRFPESVVPVRNKDLYLNIGQIYAQAGDTAELLSRIDNFTQRYTLTRNDEINIGTLYLEVLNDPSTAIQIFERLYVQNPRSGDVVGALLRGYQSAGEYDRAIEVLNSWLQFNPEDRAAQEFLKTLEQQKAG